MMTLLFFLLIFTLVVSYSGTLMIFSVFMLFLFIFFLFYGNILGMVNHGVFLLCFYLDFLSFVMIMMCFWVFAIVFLISEMDFSSINFKLYLVLFCSLILSFTGSNIYIFYFFFEFSIIPIYLIIVGKGSGFDRLISGYYMFMYTLGSSLPALYFLLTLYYDEGVGSFKFFDLIGLEVEMFWFLILVFMMAVKVPMFIFHIWLPKAHVDAPVEGSMVLASVMLKLGGYGLYRLVMMFEVDYAMMVKVYVLGLFGFFLLSLFSLLIVDVKVLIAYSSVIHMCMMVSSVFSCSVCGWRAGFCMMVSHGLCSSCMFMMANMAYERSGSRCMVYNKGLYGLMPIFSYLWLVMIFFNIGAPPSLSLLAEILGVSAVLGLDYACLMLVTLGLFFLSCSMINLYSSLCLDWKGSLFYPLKVKDYFSIFIHLIPLVLLIFVFTSVY